MTELFKYFGREFMHEQGECILVVDDDPELNQALREYLSHIGFEVYGAKNGKEALMLLDHIPKPSLILLDLKMPVMNGCEFRVHLKKDPFFASIPVIVMSAANDFCELNCKEFIKKPLQMDYMLPVIKHHFFRGMFSESEETDFDHFTEFKLEKKL